MTYITSVSGALGSVITGVMLLAAMSLFALAIYKYICTESLKKIGAEALMLTAIILFMSYIRAVYNGWHTGEIRIPYFLIILASAGVFAYSVIGMKRQYVNNKNTLSPSSVRQALDNLNSGICFCDAADRIVLINRAMSKLIYSACGHYPGTKSDIMAAVGNSDVFTTSDGMVWRFTYASIKRGGLDGYTQINAQNITEIYAANEKLKQENEELKLTNEEMQAMLNKLSDRIREQETLNLKMQIHNDIGTSLISISKLIRDGNEGDVDSKLSALQNAVSYFSHNRTDTTLKTLDEAVKKAYNIGIELVVIGDAPQEEKLGRIVVSAIDECVTNCVNHAKGDKVVVRIDRTDGLCSVKITNNGVLPINREIREGGGLSSLRRRVENYGGTMTVSVENGFLLSLSLPERSASDD